MKDTIENLTVYRRYVDDIFCVTSRDQLMEVILNRFNSAHTNASFTMEFEMNNRLAFLDVLVVRKPDGLAQRKVHRKATWNGQYTHFASAVPIQYKRNLVRCLADRARKICTRDTINDELQFLLESFIQNGYPKRFVEVHLGARSKPPKVSTADKKILYLSLPFEVDMMAHVVKKEWIFGEIN